MVRLFAEINRSAAPMLGLVALGALRDRAGVGRRGPLVTWSPSSPARSRSAMCCRSPFSTASRARRPRAHGGASSCWRPRFCGSAWAYLVWRCSSRATPTAQAFAIARHAAGLDRDVAAGGGHSGGVRRRHAADDRRRDHPLRPPPAGGRAARRRRWRSASSAISWSSPGACTRRRRRNISFQAEKDSLIAELEQAKLNSDEARRRAESANLAKSRFLATMSHELAPRSTRSSASPK